MRKSQQQKLDELATVTNVTDPSQPVPDVNARIAAQLGAGLDMVTGVPNFLQVGSVRVAMRNETLRLAICELQQSRDVQQQFLVALSSRLGSQDIELKALAAQLTLTRAAGEATQSQAVAASAAAQQLATRLAKVEAQQAADELADVARDAYDAKQDTQLQLLAARVTSDEAAAALVKAKADSTAAALALVQAQQVTDEAGLAVLQVAVVAAQKVADAAQTKADTTLAATNSLQTKVETAQAASSAAINAATTAQSRADSAATAAATAQSTATSAAATASANAATLATLQTDVASKLPAASVRRLTVNTPAVTIQVGTPATVAVTFDAFADSDYLVFLTKATGPALLNVQVGDTAKTKSSFTLTLQNTGVVSLAIAASSVEVFIIHK